MKIHLAYKYELDLNNEQRTDCARFAGVARWAYNFGLQRRNESRAIGAKMPSVFDLQKEIVRLKHSTHPWLAEVSKSVPQEALRDLESGFRYFFAKRAEYPKFKSKKLGIGGFRIHSLEIHTNGRSVQLPRLGTLRTKHETAVEGRVLFATVKERAGRWFVSITVEKDVAVTLNEGPAVGVDLGVKSLATLSDGTPPVENPKALGRKLKTLRRLNRSLSRRQKGSNRRQKMKEKIARLHYRIACVRKDALHKLTTRLAKNHGAIGIEDLNVAGLVRNRKLARAISDCGFGEFRKQLEYKCAASGGTLVVHGCFFPSSKTCSACGNIKDALTLRERTYHCAKCGLVIDRDLNAAKNLRPVGSRLQDVEGGALAPAKAGVKLPPMKRQPSAAGRKAIG